MRRDVRLLGDILGEVIRDSAGPELLADVERLRRAVIQARHGERDAWSAAGPGPVRRRSGAWRSGRGQDRGAGRVVEPGPGRAGRPRLHRLLSPGQPGRRAPAHPHPAGARFRAGAGAGIARRRGGRGRSRRRAAATWANCSPVAARAPGAHRAPHRGAQARRGGGAAPDQRAARRAGRPAGRGGRPRRGAARAARADRPAVADITAAGQGDGPDRRGPRGDGGVRRDPVPGGPHRVPGAGPGAGRGGKRAEWRRRCTPSCGSAAGWARTGTATRSSPPGSPGRPRRSRPITSCARWKTPRPGSAGR